MKVRSRNMRISSSFPKALSSPKKEEDDQKNCAPVIYLFPDYNKINIFFY